MHLFTTVKDIQIFLQECRAEGKTVGFAPTMGALHQGHLSLIELSRRDNDITVCSIFVNPRQFDDKKDLDKYPRPIEKDTEMLKGAGCDVLFIPEVEEMYPTDFDNQWSLDLGTLDKGMEGAHRPGHFHGVTVVVRRLLEIVMPDHLYMGQKDLQQFCIVQYMIKALDMPVNIVLCPIVREADGLAMSSRNVRLDETARAAAPAIYQTLLRIQELSRTATVAELYTQARAWFDRPDFDLDYFEVVRTDTLEVVSSLDEYPEIFACTTVRVGGVRLLDNIRLRP